MFLSRNQYAKNDRICLLIALEQQALDNHIISFCTKEKQAEQWLTGAVAAW